MTASFHSFLPKKMPLSIIANLLLISFAQAGMQERIFTPEKWQTQLYFDGTGTSDNKLTALIVDSQSKDKLVAGILYHDNVSNSPINNLALNTVAITAINLADTNAPTDSRNDYWVFGAISDSAQDNKNINISLAGISTITVESKYIDNDSYGDRFNKYHSAGLAAYSGGNNSNINITTDALARITANGDHVNGIFAEISQKGSETIVNNATIQTNGTNAHGIVAMNGSLDYSVSGDPIKTTIENRGDITTNGRFSSGILSYTNNFLKDVIINNYAMITVKGERSKGINAGHPVWTIGLNPNGTLGWITNPSDGSAKTIYNASTISMQSAFSEGISVGTSSSQKSPITIVNKGIIGSHSSDIADITGINVNMSGSPSVLNIDNQNYIYSYGDRSKGIVVDVRGHRYDDSYSIKNTGTIFIHNTNSARADSVGIKFISNASVAGFPIALSEIYNSGPITIDGNNSTGIYSRANYANHVVRNDGVIVVTGNDTAGIKASMHFYGNENNTIAATQIINNNEISAIGNNAKAIILASDEERCNRLGALIVNNNSSITTNGDDSAGIYIAADRIINTASHSLINSGAIESVGKNAVAIHVNGNSESLNSTQIELANGSMTIGGTGISGAAIKASDYVNNVSINNDGYISSLNNMAIVANQNSNAPLASFRLDNTGEITGNLLIEGDDIVVTNHAGGTLKLEHFDIDGFSKNAYVLLSGNNTVMKNAGNIQFSYDMAIMDNVGVYKGLSAFHMQKGGVIDLTLNNVMAPNGFGLGNFGTGDIIVISNSNLEQNGNYDDGAGTTTYYSEGGLIRLNTDLTTANKPILTDRKTDRLILDRTETIDHQATLIDIIPTLSSLLLSKKTTGDGFLLVKVKDKNHSDPEAFRLSKPVVASTNQYILGHKEGDWYLTSTCTTNMECFTTGQIAGSLYNPSIGSYLANQASMVSLTSHSLADRLSTPVKTGSHLATVNQLVSKAQFANQTAQKIQALTLLTAMMYQQQEEVVSPVWIHYSNMGSNGLVSNAFNAGNKTDYMRIGSDLLNSNAFNGDVRIGFMSTMGNSRTNIASRSTGTKTRGEINGYTMGMYGSWFNDIKSGHGLYADSWLQLGQFDNTVSGEVYRGSKENYKSQILSSSFEAGYTMPFNNGNKEKNGVVITPQVQLTYHQLSTDTHYDSNALTVKSKNSDGMIGRVGMRFATGKKGVSLGDHNVLHASFETNIIHNGLTNQLNFDGLTLSDQKAKNSVETKLGFQTDLGSQFQFNGNVSNTWSRDSSKQYGAYLGASYRF